MVFSCKKLFFAKSSELSQTETSFHFNTTLCYEKLCEKDKTNVKFLQKHVHGLSLGDENDLNKDMLDVIVKKFYTAYKTDNKSVLAYKGGSIEKDLLAKLNIPSVNLELFGCPKARNIFPEMVWSTSQLVYCCKCCNLIGYSTRYLFVNR